MFRYMLPVLAMLLLGGCACNAVVCYADVGGDPVSSGRVAGDLWEVERNRLEGTPAGETAPDTTEVPDKLSSYSQPKWR